VFRYRNSFFLSSIHDIKKKDPCKKQFSFPSTKSEISKTRNKNFWLGKKSLTSIFFKFLIFSWKRQVCTVYLHACLFVFAFVLVEIHWGLFLTSQKLQVIIREAAFERRRIDQCTLSGPKYRRGGNISFLIGLLNGKMVLGLWKTAKKIKFSCTGSLWRTVITFKALVISFILTILTL
jgi:hypothetical protein